MELRLHGVLRLAVAILITILTAVSANSQTPEELRAKYGEPQTREIKNRRTTLERYLVRPNIQMTITYTSDGRLCEASFDPVPASTPTPPVVESPPEGDYMFTADVISIIDEIVPPETRGEKTGAFHVNGGDSEIKLNHLGCSGSDWVSFESVSIFISSWCGGGTFTATIHWNNTKCQGERLPIKKKR